MRHLHPSPVAISLLLVVAAACTVPSDEGPSTSFGIGGSADTWASERQVEVLLTDPHCDLCTAADKDVLRARSAIVSRVVELLDGAERSVDIAQFTFSVREIEEAIVRAHGRGLAVRVAMNAAQDQSGTVARRLREAGVPVRFVSGRSAGGSGPGGLLHAKFMIVDGSTLLTGSNNWSSTGTTINEENTLVFRSAAGDPLVAGFACHFASIWSGNAEAAVSCSADGMAFTPGTAAVRLLRDGIRGAETSVDVLMHHFLFTDLVNELARAAERGVLVRVVVNAEDRGELNGRAWDRLRAAGGLIRFKRGNAEQYQLMHHKLAIVDGQVLLNGSGNWSGSAFFNNYENYVRYEDPRVVAPFVRSFERIWSWSLSAASLDQGLTAAEQHAAESRIFFGNLHSHVYAFDGGRLLDDGHPEVLGPNGEVIPVEIGTSMPEAARYAFEYGRDRGGLDFLAVTPHAVGEGWDRPADTASLTPAAYEELIAVAAAVTDESGGAYLALPGMEWSTNGSGNHVNVLGSAELATVVRGRFDLLYDHFLPSRAWAGDPIRLMWNHPRTFVTREDALEGNWDQIFGVNLREIPGSGERNQKFNDYGLDDYSPMSEVRAAWLAGDAMPDPVVVDETLERIRVATEPYLRMMEVLLGRGTELGGEVATNPSLTPVRDEERQPTGELERQTRVHSDWDYYLLRGFRMAPAASHDSHYANWGAGHSSRTAVLAERLSERALLEAIDRRALYASEDQNLQLRYYAAGRVPMGGSLATVEAGVEATVGVSDPDYGGPFVITVFRGRVGAEAVEAVATHQAGGAGVVPVLLPVPDRGEYFFYVRVHEPGPDRMAWSSPIWVERL